MGLFDGGDLFGSLGSAVADVAGIALAPETGGLSLAALAPAGISGAASLLGGSQANQKTWDIAQATNAASLASSREQMAFQERMRSTQYQTAVQDLQKAGLNPMLAYTQGGAGTPVGAMPTYSTPHMKDAVTPAISSALSAYQGYTDAALRKEQTLNTSAQTALTNQSAIKAVAETAKINQDEKTSQASEKVNLMNLQQIAQQINQSMSQIRLNSALTGEAAARTKNEQENTAKTANPWWVNGLLRYGKTLSDKWDEIRSKQK